MSLKFTVHANPNQIMISASQTGWSEQLSSVIALGKDDKIYAIGAEAEEMSLAENLNEEWVKYQFRFINPFELDKYGPRYAVAIVNFHIGKALKKMGRDLTLGRLFNHFDFDIWLWNYDILSTETKYEFEQALRQTPLLKVGTVTFNGNKNTKPSAEFFQLKKQEARQRKIADYSFRMFSILWMGLLFVGLYWVTPRSILSNPIKFDSFGWSIVIGLLVLILGIIYLGIFLGAVSWMYVMRHYLPVLVIKELLPTLGISKLLVNWAADKILGNELGNK